MSYILLEKEEVKLIRISKESWRLQREKENKCNIKYFSKYLEAFKQYYVELGKEREKC